MSDETTRFMRLNQRMTETGTTGAGLRCRFEHDDPTTPSGITRCQLDHGHTGDHIHVNGRRMIEWA